MCTHIARQRRPLASDNLDRSTSDHSRLHRSMYRYTDGRAFLECLAADFAYKILVTVPNIPDPYRLVVCARDCMVSVENDIWEKYYKNVNN